MAIIAKFTRTLPAPTATISGGFVFLLSAGWFTDADLGVAGSPIGGGANSIANGGGDMQIFSNTGTTTRLPIEVVTFVTGGSPQCQVWVRTPSYTAGDTITIGKDDTQSTQPAVGAAFGRNAAWVDLESKYHCVTAPFTGASDATGNHADLVASSGTWALDSINAAWNSGGTESVASLSYTGATPTAYTLEQFVRIPVLANYAPIISMSFARAWGEAGQAHGSSNGTVYAGISVADRVVTSSGTLIAATWQKWALVYNGTQTEFFIDGVSKGVSTTTTTPKAIGGFLLANRDNSGSTVDYKIKNASYSLTAKTANQLLSESINEKDPDNFGTSSEYILVGGGGISVTGDTAAFDFTALAGTVDLTGEILVTGSTASFDYSAISGAIDLTGQLLVTGQTANFDYIALPGTIDLTGEIIVTGSTANFDYTGENGVIELGAVINVVGQTANFDVNGVSAEVSLTGEITIIGDTATFDYVAKSGIVVIGEGQKIGTVTAGFADSTIGVQYKQNTITVNFGE